MKIYTVFETGNNGNGKKEEEKIHERGKIFLNSPEIKNKLEKILKKTKGKEKPKSNSKINDPKPNF
jgi:hypothetical protein